MATITLQYSSDDGLDYHVMKAHHDEPPTMVTGWDSNQKTTLKEIIVGQRYSLIWWVGPGSGDESFKLTLTATEHTFESTGKKRMVINPSIAATQKYTAGHRYFMLV